MDDVAASEYFECTKVGVEFLKQSNNVFICEEVIAASPGQIFEVFEDAHAWTVWAMPIQKVVWTSPKPYGVGTTREVHMMGDMVGYEEFVEWQPAMETRGFSKKLMFLTRPIMRIANRRMFKKFKNYAEGRYSLTPPA